jgi:hypothetical protein
MARLIFHTRLGMPRYLVHIWGLWGPVTGMEKPQENPTTISDQDIEHSDTTGPKQEHQFPEGGLRAWLVVLGSAFAMFSTFGYINSFGSVPNFSNTLALVCQCIDSAGLVYIKNNTSAIN